MDNANTESVASTPSIYTDIFDSLSNSTRPGRGSHSGGLLNSQSPNADSHRLDQHTDIYQAVIKARLTRSRIESTVSEENQRIDHLFDEGEALKNDIVRYSDIVMKLHDKRNEADSIWRSTLTKYNAYQHNFSTLQSAVEEIKTLWKDELADFNRVSKKLFTLREKKTQLERELSQISEHCDFLTDKITSVIAERNRLCELDTRLEAANNQRHEAAQFKSEGTQTLCNFKVMSEIDVLREKLSEQTRTVKTVREAIDLVRRCS